MGVAHAAGLADVGRLDNGQVVVECAEVESVVADGEADLFFVYGIALKVGEKIAVELIVGVCLRTAAAEHERNSRNCK